MIYLFYIFGIYIIYIFGLIFCIYLTLKHLSIGTYQFHVQFERINDWSVSLTLAQWMQCDILVKLPLENDCV